ncbi:hypothetical protein [Falsihalocynthiibacter arcticus]|uniref:N-acetyltransferase domain-containing protein n=1 Tax=Falsihalocynthiibacter arcticus TaxID=1579316 RepID=A0A126V130_9RHOB|nr:hypothetical protein [Falsihalocynthiibacter arcticus]AML52003.1 hypothetical protein RC74_12635 [Falsihalocynthiibacter arcticus]
MTQQTFKTEGAKITAYLDGPRWEGVPAATVGGFSCTSVDAGVEVLAQALAYIRASGPRRVLGPMERDTWHSYRAVTQSDDSPAFLLEPAAQSLVLEVLQATGFTEISSYFSARVPLAQTAQTPPPATEDFTIEAWNGKNPEGLFEQVFTLSTQAFAKNAFYKPITHEAFMAMYMPIVPLLKQELIFFARRPDQSLAGFLFGTPNYAEGPNPTSAILKTYASLSKGAGQHLAYAFHTAAKKAGYTSAIHALIHDDNLSALRSASEEADIFRRYGLFGLKLDD